MPRCLFVARIGQFWQYFRSSLKFATYWFSAPIYCYCANRVWRQMLVNLNLDVGVRRTTFSRHVGRIQRDILAAIFTISSCPYFGRIWCWGVRLFVGPVFVFQQFLFNKWRVHLLHSILCQILGTVPSKFSSCSLLLPKPTSSTDT